MEQSVMDIKLKSLINVCKQSGNTKKLAIVSFILTSNILDEIGIKLGIRPRDKDSGENILGYMKIINSVLLDNFNIKLIDNEIIHKIKIIEPLLIKRKGDIPIDYIKEIFSIYYDLKKLDVPNFYEQLDDNYNSSNSALYSLYSSNTNKKNKNKNKNKSDKLKFLLLHKINEEELALKKKLNKKYDRGLFENAIYLKSLKNSLKNDGTNKTEIKGSLKENISYQGTFEDLLGYSFIGAFILFFLLGLVITIEALFYPSLTGSLSILLLLSFGTSVLFFVLYWNYFWRISN